MNSCVLYQKRMRRRAKSIERNMASFRHMLLLNVLLERLIQFVLERTIAKTMLCFYLEMGQSFLSVL